LAAAQEYFDTVGTEGLPSMTGELRPFEGCRPGELRLAGWDGAFSGRADLSAAAAAAERSLELLAEPLCALWLEPWRWPGEEFAAAWDRLVRSAGSRFIAPATARAEDAPWERTVNFGLSYGDVANLAGAACQLALANAALACDQAGAMVINPSACTRSGVVEVTSSLFEVTPILSGVTDQARSSPTEPGTQDLGDGRALVWAGKVPGYGWTTLPNRAPSVAGTPQQVAAPDLPEAVQAPSANLDETSLSNGLVELAVNRTDGSFAVNGYWGLGWLVDEADAGNTQAFRRPADLTAGRDALDGAFQPCRSRPVSVDVEVLESGPLRGRIVVVRRYAWPYLAAEVLTELELRAGETMVRVTTSFFNERPGHRMRAVFALPTRAERSLADCAFYGSERPVRPEASYPTKTFVCAGGVVVAHDGLSEYAVGADGWALGLTLLRSTSADLAPSAGAKGLAPAGPEGSPSGWEGGSGLGPWARACPGPEQLGRHVVRYAVALGDSSLGPAGGLDPWRLAEEAFVPLQVVLGHGGGSLPSRGTHLQVAGARVSALRRQGDYLELRTFNPSAEAVLVDLPGRRGQLVDLQGNYLANWEQSFAMAPWSIATAHIS
jgi:hypothetical protein